MIVNFKVGMRHFVAQGGARGPWHGSMSAIGHQDIFGWRAASCRVGKFYSPRSGVFATAGERLYFGAKTAGGAGNREKYGA